MVVGQDAGKLILKDVPACKAAGNPVYAHREKIMNAQKNAVIVTAFFHDICGAEEGTRTPTPFGART